ARSSSASALVRSDASIVSSIIRWRSSSSLLMRGNANLARMIIAAAKASSVQIIRPGETSTSGLPPPSSAANGRVSASLVIVLDEERDQARDEPVEDG